MTIENFLAFVTLMEFRETWIIIDIFESVLYLLNTGFSKLIWGKNMKMSMLNKSCWAVLSVMLIAPINSFANENGSHPKHHMMDKQGMHEHCQPMMAEMSSLEKQMTDMKAKMQACMDDQKDCAMANMAKSMDEMAKKMSKMAQKMQSMQSKHHGKMNEKEKHKDARPQDHKKPHSQEK